jgi:hypothetical protein
MALRCVLDENLRGPLWEAVWTEALFYYAEESDDDLWRDSTTFIP